jgi:hypothetical protein
MKLWWQIYRPVIVSDQYTEDFFQKMTLEQFKEIFLVGLRLPIAIHIIMAEYYWIKARKPNYFIEKGVADFVLHTDAEHTINEIQFNSPIGISWHPDDAKKHDLAACLVYPTKPAIIIHVNDTAVQGTWTAIIPRDKPPSEIDLKYSPYCGEMPKGYSEEIHKKRIHTAECAVFGLLTYMQAFPELVHPGLPVTIKDRCMRYFKGTGNCIALHPKIRAVPSAHYRTGHWRCLAHERFRRNPDGSIRIIYVNPAIVGFLTPFVVEDQT